MPAMAPVEGVGVPREEAPHEAGEGAVARPEEEVIGQQGPGEHLAPGRLHLGAEAGEEVRPVGVIAEAMASFEPPHHDVVQDAGRRRGGAGVA